MFMEMLKVCYICELGPSFKPPETLAWRSGSKYVQKDMSIDNIAVYFI